MRKDRKPLETISIINNILLQNGLAYRIIEVINNNDLFYSVRVEFEQLTGIGSNGKGITYELALASALAELMERIQSRNNLKFWYSVKKYPDKSLYPEYTTNEVLCWKIRKYFDNYKKSKLYKFRLDYQNILTKEKISFPNRLINLLCGSNGLCAGNSRKEAISQGICEIFERYVRKMIAKQKMDIQEIDKDHLRGYEIFEKLSVLDNAGYYWQILDCSDKGSLPVVGLLVLDQKKEKYLLTLGADIDFSIALERCITELLQGRSLENLYIYMNDIDYQDRNYKKLEWTNTKESAYYDFIDNYISNTGGNPLNILYGNKSKTGIPDAFRKCDTNDEAYGMITRILEKQGWVAYIYDYSYLGFCTYRVYIPGITEVFEISPNDAIFWGDFKENLNTLINIKRYHRGTFLKKLESLSCNMNYRRNNFQDIFFRFLGDKDFDFNFIYLDFLIALLYAEEKEYRTALRYYTRFVDEQHIFSFGCENELLKIVYSYLVILKENNGDINDAYEKLKLIYTENTNKYVYEIFVTDKLFEMVYWPSCPNCEECSYEGQCLYAVWDRIDKQLLEKQEEFYQFSYSDKA